MKQKRITNENKLRTLYHISQVIGNSLNLQEILHKIIQYLSTLTKCDSCFIYLYNKTLKELTLMASKNPHPKILGKIKLKLGEGITGWAAKIKKPVVIEKKAYTHSHAKIFNQLPEDKYESFLSLPIISKAEVIGVINIQHKKVHYYPKSFLTLLWTVAQQVSGFITNAELYTTTTERMKQIETLLEISKSIVSNKYIDEILSLIVKLIADLSGFNICSIMLLDEKKNELVIKATQSLDKEYLEKPAVKIEQSISGKAIIEKRVIIVNDVKQEQDYMFPVMAQKLGLCSMLSVPMMIKDKVMGVINSYTKVIHKFTEEEVKIIQTIAHQVSVAIENTRLIDEVKSTKRELETRKLVERAKGVLMKELDLVEEAAYKIIHKKSMDTGKSMREIAEAIIIADTIKGNK